MQATTGIRIVMLLIGMLVANAAMAFGLQLEYGDGDDGIKRYGAALQWEWQRKWFTEGDWYLGGYWELSGSYWDGDPGRYNNDSLGEFGFTPVFRLQPHNNSGFRPFVEAGLGGHVLTENELEDKDFSIAWQFGSHLGAGVQFGSNNQFELLYRFQHLSNASLGDSNPGINFHVFRLGLPVLIFQSPANAGFLELYLLKVRASGPR